MMMYDSDRSEKFYLIRGIQMKEKKHRFLPYRQAIPSILLLQIINMIAISVWGVLFSWLSRMLLQGAGKVAVSSGDFLFLFTHWQGYVVILLALVTVMLFIGLEVNSLIVLSNRLLSGEKPSVLLCIKEGVLSIKKLIGPRGLLIVLYLGLLSPILGFGVTISLTQNLYIPNFIMSVVESKAFFLIPAIIVFILLFLVGIVFVFILHGLLLDKMSLKESGKNSVQLIKKYWKNFIVEMLIFLLFTALVVLVLYGILAGVRAIGAAVDENNRALMTVTIGLLITVLMLAATAAQLYVPFLFIKLTSLYKTYQSGGEWRYEKRPNRKSPLVIAYVIVAVLLIGILTAFVAFGIDSYFPAKVSTGFIAHRAGGFEAPENTVAGIDAAHEYGAWGAEIDIQRTKDGYYVVNHDADFARTAGLAKKPSELTLEEVKQLKVDGEPVPTYEEMLEASRDRVVLFVELKGETADQQMADDAVKIIKEYNMVDQTVVISLGYELIDYIETNYPEINTGYLAFASFGDTASYNCDYLALEEETATSSMIEEIHEAGKKILVWTVNEDDDIEDFLRSGADAIITDAVKRSSEITKELEEQPPVERVLDAVIRFFFVP